MDFIALDDQLRAEAKDALKDADQFLLFSFPGDGKEGSPTVYASCQTKAIMWAAAYLAHEIMHQALADATIEFIGDEEGLPQEIRDALRKARGEE